MCIVMAMLAALKQMADVSFFHFDGKIKLELSLLCIKLQTCFCRLNKIFVKLKN